MPVPQHLWRKRASLRGKQKAGNLVSPINHSKSRIVKRMDCSYGLLTQIPSGSIFTAIPREANSAAIVSRRS